MNTYRSNRSHPSLHFHPLATLALTLLTLGLFLFIFAVIANAQDGNPPPPVTADSPWKPLLELLTGKFGWLAAVIGVIGTIRLPMKLVSGWLQRVFTAYAAKVYSTPETDDDEKLNRILGSLWYRTLANLLDAALSFKLPTADSLTLHVVKSVNPLNLPDSIAKTVATLAICFSLFGLAGCQSGPVQVKAGADPIVVHAEWLAENAASSFDSFFDWERANANIPQAVHSAAENLRGTDTQAGLAENSIKDLRAATAKYKADKTTANGVDVKAGIAAVLGLANSVRAHMGLPALTLPAIAPSATDLMLNAPTNGPPQ